MNKKYSIKKTVLKLVKVFVYGGVGAVASYLTNLPSTPVIVLVVGVLVALENFLKHSKNG